MVSFIKDFFNSSLINKVLSNVTEPRERKGTYLAHFLYETSASHGRILWGIVTIFYSPCLPKDKSGHDFRQALVLQRKFFIIQNLGLGTDIRDRLIPSLLRKISVLKNLPTWSLSKLVLLLCHDMIYFQISLLLVHKLLHAEHNGH